jgi:hypothetical protein
VWDPETGRNLAAVRVDGGLRNCCHVPGGNDIVLVGDPHVYLMTYLSG